MSLGGNGEGGPRILIFDNDGTLVPSHLTANQAIREAFGEFCGMHRIEAESPTDERICALTGQPGDLFYRALLPEPNRDRAPELRSYCLDREVVAMREGASFYPGLDVMLHELRRRSARLVIATHGGERYVSAVAERLSYERIFDRVYYHGYEGLVSKAEMARRAIRELGPGEAVFVGDRRADLEAAQEVGIQFIGCLYGYGSREELEGAAVLVESPAELSRLLLAADNRSPH